MNIFSVIILSVIEGITEFLPISSTGHLILASKIMGIASGEFIKSFEIAIQSGAILAVLVLYGKKLFENKNLFAKVGAAFIPTGILGFVFYKAIKHMLGSSIIVVASLFLGGVVLLFIEKFLAQNKNLRFGKKNLTAGNNSLANLSYPQAIFIGTLQSLSMIPGVSRAAATIIAGLSTGLNRAEAVEFSFLLAIPTMLAATGLDLFKSYKMFTSSDTIYLLIGIFVSFFVAMFAIKLLLKFIKTNSFIPFGIYRIIASVLFFFIMR